MTKKTQSSLLLSGHLTHSVSPSLCPSTLSVSLIHFLPPLSLSCNENQQMSSSARALLVARLWGDVGRASCVNVGGTRLEGQPYSHANALLIKRVQSHKLALQFAWEPQDRCEVQQYRQTDTDIRSNFKHKHTCTNTHTRVHVMHTHMRIQKYVVTCAHAKEQELKIILLTACLKAGAEV